MRKYHDTMKLLAQTNILDDLELDDDTQAAYRREAVRTGKPVAIIIREKLLAAARALNSHSTRQQLPVQGRAAK